MSLKGKTKILVTTILLFSLSLPRLCLAMDDLLGGLVGSVGVAGLLGASIFIASGQKGDGRGGGNGTESSAVAHASLQTPVILSSSTDKLLSVGKKSAVGVIKVLNAGPDPVTRFDVKLNNNPINKQGGGDAAVGIMSAAVVSSDPPTSGDSVITVDGGVIVVDSNSSCFDPVLAGGVCEFDVTYTGSSDDEARTSIVVEVGNDPNTSDSETITAINIPHKVFFKPDADGTGARDLGSSDLTSFVTILKNGVSVLYVGSYTMGVYKSTDGGDSWSVADNGIPEWVAINFLHVVGQVLYAGTSDGIFKTVDGGSNWIRSGFEGENVTILHSLDNDLYAVVDGRVYRGNSTGSGWTDFGDGLLYESPTPQYKQVCSTDVDGNESCVGSFCKEENGSEICFLYSDVKLQQEVVTVLNQELQLGYAQTLESIGNILYVGTSNGEVFRSVGGGRWEAINDGLSGPVIFSLHAIGEVLYAGTFDGGVYKLVNGYTTWEQTELMSFINKDSQADPNGIKYENVVVKDLQSLGSDLYVVTSGEVFTSADSGQTWSGEGFANAVFRSNDGGITWHDACIDDKLVTFRIIDNVLYKVTSNIDVNGCHYFEVYKSTDRGANWKKINDGLSDKHIKFIHSVDSGGSAGLYAATFGRSVPAVYKSIDEGVNWVEVDCGFSEYNEENEIWSIQAVGDDLYIGTWNGVLKVTDGGVTCEDFNDGLENLHVLTLHAVGDVLYAGTDGDGVFKFVPGGSGWEATALQGEAVRIIHSDYDDLYAGTYKSGVFKSEDGGMTWSNIGLLDKCIWSLYSFNDELYVGAVNNDYNLIGDGRNIYEVKGGGVFKYDGNDWQEVGGELTDRNVFTLSAIDDVLYAGADEGGVFRLEDDGKAWMEVDVGLLDYENVMILYAVGDDLYAGTDVGGIFKSIEK